MSKLDLIGYRFINIFLKRMLSCMLSSKVNVTFKIYSQWRKWSTVDKNTLWAPKIHFFNTGNTLLLLWGLAGLQLTNKASIWKKV